VLSGLLVRVSQEMDTQAKETSQVPEKRMLASQKGGEMNKVLICTKCGKIFPIFTDGIFCEDCGGTFTECDAEPEKIREMVRQIQNKEV
jgi:rRNA maturation endonuclease Nob1